MYTTGVLWTSEVDLQGYCMNKYLAHQVELPFTVTINMVLFFFPSLLAIKYCSSMFERRNQYSGIPPPL